MHIQQNHFSAHVLKPSRDFWLLEFRVQPIFCTTTQLPEISSHLNTLLPEILVAACDNPKQLPFYLEMMDTQTAHLFEHIVLEYLCKLRLNEGAQEASYEGRTFWDATNPSGEESTIAVSRQGETILHFAHAVRLSAKLLTRLIHITQAAYTGAHAERGVQPLPVYAMPT